MQVFLQDLRYGFRTLLKNPSSSLVAILALALGIGANTAIFSVINGVLVKPLPYPEPDRLAVVWGLKASAGLNKLKTTIPDFADFAKENDVFEKIGALKTEAGALTGGDLPTRVDVTAVSPAIFDMLGLHPVIGRRFQQGEDTPGKERVAILSNGLWQRRFAAQPSALNTTLTLNGQPYEIIGVAPAGFQVLDTHADLYVPLAIGPKDLQPSQRGTRSVYVLGKLLPGVSVERAQERLRAVSRRIEETYPDYATGFSVDVASLREATIGETRSTIWMLTGAVAFVLLIACANVANLLLARAGSREKEIAVRTSLGANAGRLVRQLLTESVLLSVIGGLLGLILAFWGTAALIRLAPLKLPRANEIAFDWRVLIFTFVVSVGTGILFGLAPALSTVNTDLNSVLRSSGRGTTGHRRRSRLRDMLVISEISACVVLLIGAGLLLHSFARLSAVDPGFRTDHVLTMQLSLPAPRYTGLRIAQFYQKLLTNVRTLPGVQSTGISRYLPLNGPDASLNFQIEGAPAVASADQPRAKFRAISPGYFKAMRIPLLRGRYFEETDGEHTPKAAILNEAAARRFFPNQDPIGKRILSGVDENAWSTIVGVVGNIKHSGLDAAVNPETYYDYLQIPPDQMPFIESLMALVVRTSGDPTSLANAVRDQVRSIDPDQPVFNVKTMSDVVNGSVAEPRFRAALLAAFAGLALLLAALGLYGVISYSVSQRTNELGVRSALGANASDLLKLVLSHGARLALIGIAIGIPLAFLLGRLLSRLLFGVNAADPITFGVTSLLIFAVALLASYFPARRATKIDPLDALRTE